MGMRREVPRPERRVRANLYDLAIDGAATRV